jgi:hypothetical protein
LTPQQHYDWGLRALKTVLRGCGNLLQKAKQGGGKVIQVVQFIQVRLTKIFFVGTLFQLRFINKISV